MRLRAAALLACAACAACASCASSPSSVVQAPVDLTIAPIGGGAAAPGASPSVARSCTLLLTASDIAKSEPSCFLDEHITTAPGELTYPCDGNGPAEARFSAQVYRGAIVDGRLELTAETELDWDDGCRWGTTATVRGQLVAQPKPTLRTLAWSYGDRVLHGSACSGVCTATARLTVTQPPAAANAKHPLEDDASD